MSGLMLVAILAALGGLGSVLTGVAWWFAAGGFAAIVLLAAAVVRGIARHRLWATLAGFLAGVFSLTLFFAPTDAIFGVLPTFETLGDLQKLQNAGLDSIATQQVPADAVTGIVYLVCLGVAGIAVAMDALAFAVRAPALTGIPLLVLLLVPGIVAANLADAFFFALTAAAWLAILLVRSRPAGRRAAVWIGAAALVAALILPIALPRVDAGVAASGGGASLSTGINPIITLGDDLRQGDEKLAISYTTTEQGGEYLRLAALDDFTGSTWKPSAATIDPANDIGAIGPVPGLEAGVAALSVTSTVNVANILTRWLPVPYAPRSIDGVIGAWAWDADALSIRTDRSNARNQHYEVHSLQIAPTIEQLVTAGTTVAPGLERYLVVPADLPAIVATTAAQVVGNAATNYDKAIALQGYFTGGLFTYSEDAPVKQGYDGSGASVLAAFLTAKSGYCVHFSSAMASMARTLGIPARVAVGFTPGSAVKTEGSELPEYRVTTHDLHAWPELYFSGVGWVRFEPTPGRGVAPAFAPLSIDDPATPNVDESKPVPPPTPTAAATAAATPAPGITKAPATADPATAPDAAPPTPPSPWVFIVPIAVLLSLPFLVRAFRRQRRIGRLDAGSALAGWEELRDTADDLGLRTSDARTPRQLGVDLAAHLDDDGAAALARLRASLESEAFAHPEGGAPPGADDLRAVLRALRRDAGLAKRIAATLLPRSLFATWLPAASIVEPD
jgi:transglutaminase-like putative cysteine protease